jgi:uncharacterized protein YerC
MPRASRKRIKRDLEEELKDHFAYLISSLNNSYDIEKFFEDFLTEEEKTMLTKRLMLHLMLENGYKIFQIESVLGLSRETIRVHQNIWSRGSEVYKKIIAKIARREKAKVFWQKVEKIFKPIDLMLRAKNDMKARSKLMGGDWMSDS